MNMRRLLLLWVSVGMVAVAGVSRAGERCMIYDLNGGYLVGAWDGEAWVKAEVAKGWIQGGESYRVVGLDGDHGATMGGKARVGGDPCDWNVCVDFDPDPMAGKEEWPHWLALACSWNPQPRPMVVKDATQEVYRKFMAKVLVDEGMPESVFAKSLPVLTQILRCDLDGDGEEEAIVSGSRFGPFSEGGEASEHPHPQAKKGDYSAVFFRRMDKAGVVHTELIAGEVYGKDDPEGVPSYYKVAAVLDLNGDGKMEIVLETGYYEGGATLVVEIQDGKPVIVLEEGCGV